MLTSTYVLSLMLLAVPAPSAAVRATYEGTAEAIAALAQETPLFSGEDGPARTAAVLVAVGRFESGLNPSAEGDCDKTSKSGTCVRGSKAHSFCLLQINETNLAGLRTSKAEILSDVRACVRAGLALMKESFRICRAVPVDDRLAWYAAGAGTCGATEDAKKKSRHRMTLARWLHDRAPKVEALVD